MEDIIQKCTNCKQIPDDILMLSCDHDLCLNCAAIIFVSENTSIDSRLLTCLECGQSTELDKASVYELQKIHVELQIQKKLNASDIKRQQNGVFQGNNSGLNGDGLYERQNQNPYISNSRINTQENSNPSNNLLDNYQARISPNQGIGSQQYLNEQSLSSAQQVRQQQSPLIQNSQIQQQNQQNVNQVLYQQQQQIQPQQDIPQQTKRYCQDHHEEEILYYCFQCASRCICPECVIHGAHKNHEVKTIKKAYPIIKQKVEEFQQKIDFKLKQISQRKAQLESETQEINQNTQSLKKQIELVFSEIKQKIIAKEREILQICDQVLAQNIKEVENLNFCLEEKLIDFKQTIELVYDHENQPDETLLLDFYATNQRKLEEIQDNREWEKKLLYSNPEFYLVNSREIQKQLALIEHQIQKVEPQIDIKDQNIVNNNVQVAVTQNAPEQVINSQSQINNSGFLRESQNYTPSANKKSQIPSYRPPQQVNQYQEILSQRSPIHNITTLDDPFRTQQYSRDQKLTEIDFDKLREKLASKQKQSSSKNNVIDDQQLVQPFQQNNFASFAQQNIQQQQQQQANTLNYMNQSNIQNSNNNSSTKIGQYLKQ